jgi:mono/diheme cytochrome c family protein
MSNIKAYRATSNWLCSILFLAFLTLNFNIVSAQDVEAGQKLFKQNCATCHRIDDKMSTGPGLAGVEERVPSKDWLYQWIKNNNALRESGNAYANKIFNDNKKSVMTQFQFLSNEDIDNILHYVKNPPPLPPGEEPVPVPEAKEDNPLLWLLILLVVFAIVVNVLIGVKRSLKNLLLEREGKDALPDVSHWEAFKVWVSNNQARVVVMCLVLALIGGKEGFHALKDNVGVYQGYAPEQPIAFSHKIHAGQNGIDCVYCHHSAEKGKTSAIPSVNVCMNCHSSISEGKTTGEAEIAKIYEAAGYNPETREYDKPEKAIKWVKIHNLPDFVYFNHSQHVVVGEQECQTCHGEVQEFGYPMHQENDLTMGWCIDCHRETGVAMEGNEYYDKMHTELKEKYAAEGKTTFTVEDIGGLECAKCHY